MKKKSMGKLLIIGVVFTLIIIAIAIVGFTGYQVTEGVYHLTDREETVKQFHENGEKKYKAFAEQYHPQKIMVPSSRFSHQIPCMYIDAKDDKGLVVLAHGLGGTKESLTDQAELFLSMGFDVIALDLRNAGENLAETNTFGQYESYDILDVLAYSKKRNTGTKILWGESMGGLAVSVACGRNAEDIDYLILDCPVVEGFQMIDDQFQKIEKENGIPRDLMAFSGNIVSRLRFGFSFSDLDARVWLKDSTVPVLIFNSKTDAVTPVHMGNDLYQAITEKEKMLVTYDNAKHVELLKTDPDLYRSSIEKLFTFSRKK